MQRLALLCGCRVLPQLLAEHAQFVADGAYGHRRANLGQKLIHALRKDAQLLLSCRQFLPFFRQPRLHRQQALASGSQLPQLARRELFRQACHDQRLTPASHQIAILFVRLPATFRGGLGFFLSGLAPGVQGEQLLECGQVLFRRLEARQHGSAPFGESRIQLVALALGFLRLAGQRGQLLLAGLVSPRGRAFQ